MTTMTRHTMRAQVARGAVAGAIVLNIPTLVWGWYVSETTLISGLIVLGALGAALGALAAWMIAPNRWDRWWKDHHRRERGSETVLPQPDDLAR